MKFTTRTFAVLCVAVIGVYVMWLGNKVNNTLSGPGWCATAFGAGKVTGTEPVKGLDACVGLLTIQLRSVSTNSHILLGTLALCLAVLMIIVVAGAKFSGEVSEHGARMDVAPNAVAQAADQVAGAAVDQAQNIKEQTNG